MCACASVCCLLSVSVTVSIQYLCLGALDRAPVNVIQSETASRIGVWHSVDPECRVGGAGLTLV